MDVTGSVEVGVVVVVDVPIVGVIGFVVSWGDLVEVGTLEEDSVIGLEGMGNAHDVTSSELQITTTRKRSLQVNFRVCIWKPPSTLACLNWSDHLDGHASNKNFVLDSILSQGAPCNLLELKHFFVC
ncbi:MAG TPA: hypothetical protein VFD19_03505 [Clostridia bacterium]|nr:hypothetical protein [Clostridia bacterium]